MRITGLYLNPIQTALVCRKALLENDLLADTIESNDKPSIFGEDVKVVSSRILKPIMLTPAEKDEVVVKYKSGMTMTAIADIYGCHRTTVRNILMKRRVAIREQTY